MSVICCTRLVLIFLVVPFPAASFPPRPSSCLPMSIAPFALLATAAPPSAVAMPPIVAAISLPWLMIQPNAASICGFISVSLFKNSVTLSAASFT